MTVFERLESAARRNPERLAFTWIDESGGREDIRAGELFRRSRAHALALQKRGLRHEDLVLLAMDYSSQLLPLILGCMAGGGVPAVLVYVSEQAEVAPQVERVRRMAAQSGARAVVCPKFLAPALATALGEASCLVIPAETLPGDVNPDEPLASTPGEDDLAVLQFTSGTTGGQKGVRVSHRAMLTYLEAYREIFHPSPADVVVSWLPLYHDMGLITGVMFTLIEEMRSVQMSPAYWVRSPITLLREIHTQRGSLTWMPNFAFSHIVRSVRESDLAGLDLSSWRMSVNGAEPIRIDSLNAFCERLAPYGYRRETMCGGYGMAENVLTASFGMDLHADWVDVEELKRSGKAVPAPANAPGAVAFVSNGPRLSTTDLAIFDDQNRDLGERRIGEIVLRSTHLFDGYHQRPDLTDAAVIDGWFHSGDLGYIADGELYICGRKKDLIIVGGSNIFPEDIEAIADRVEGVQAGRAVAFGLFDDELGTERIVLLCELRKPLEDEALRTIDRQLRKRVFDDLGVAIGVVRFLPRGWILKTSSGKLARAANRDKYLAEFREVQS